MRVLVLGMVTTHLNLLPMIWPTDVLVLSGFVPADVIRRQALCTQMSLRFSNFAWHWENTNTSVNHNIKNATPNSTCAVSNKRPQNALQQVNF